MEKREIKFKAFFCIGEIKEIKAIVEDVVVYPSGSLGCYLDAFTDALLEHTQWKFEDGEFTHTADGRTIEGYKYDVSEGDEWIFFEGIPLQYLGLNDKNSVEIFEGAIIKDSKRNNSINVIEYFENGFCLNDKTRSNWDAADIEVIGNIHVNPELL